MGQILGGGGELLADRQRILQAGAAVCPFNGIFRPLGFQILRHGAVAVDLVFYPHISARHKYGIGGGIVQRCTLMVSSSRRNLPCSYSVTLYSMPLVTAYNSGDGWGLHRCPSRLPATPSSAAALHRYIHPARQRSCQPSPTKSAACCTRRSRWRWTPAANNRLQ